MMTETSMAWDLMQEEHLTEWMVMVWQHTLPSS